MLSTPGPWAALGLDSPCPSCPLLPSPAAALFPVPFAPALLPSQTGEELSQAYSWGQCNEEGRIRETGDEVLPLSPSPASCGPWLTGSKKNAQVDPGGTRSQGGNRSEE